MNVLSEKFARKTIDIPLEHFRALLDEELTPLFWQPSLLEKPSAWFGHIPFAHWLVRHVKPRILVELGTHAGVSYSAFCSAVLREGLETRCFAVDTWRGDDQAGHYSEEIYSDLFQFNKIHYDGFSTLLRHTFDEALTHILDGSVDILHIDGFHSYEAVSHDFSTWRRKLSDHAVVLFHDTNEYKEGFGVWRFWAEIKEQYPNFEFSHSHGLGVLCVGKSPPPILAELCKLGASDTVDLRERFQLVGERWAFDGRLRRQTSEMERLIDENKALKKQHSTRAGERRNAVLLEAKNRALQLALREAAIRLDGSQILEQQFGVLQQEQAALLNSSSWRMTAPVRAILAQVRRPMRFVRHALFGARHLKRQYQALERSPFFNGHWYANRYPDVQIAGIDPIAHYLEFGANEGRNPSSEFDTSYYLAANPEVALAGVNPLYHYIISGHAEQRAALPVDSRGRAIEYGESTNISQSITLEQRIDETRHYQKWDSVREGVFLAFVDEVYAASKLRYDSTLITIIMPTFNRADVIDKAIESVRSQSHQHWQLIIIDDGSEDATREILEPYLSDDRISYVYQDNAGVSAARNAGLLRAQGDWVFYLDSDNVWKINHLRSLMVYMDQCNLAAAYSGLECVDDDGVVKFYRGTDFSYDSCLVSNYIDLNCFAHRADLARVFEYDVNLKRLVDWEFILKLTKLHRTAYAPFLGVTYYGGNRGNRITKTEYNGGELPGIIENIRERHVLLNEHFKTIRQIHPDDQALSHLQASAIEKCAVPSKTPRLRIGYIVWDWPALSQTFVINEVRWLVQRGIDVKVYYSVDPDKACELDFSVDTFKVAGAEDLLDLIVQHKRNALHSPFAYPATTLLTWPTATATKLPFTFMPGGVDISHFENRKRNKIAEVASSEQCAGVITLGTYHKDFLIDQGVPSNRIVMERQAVAMPNFRQRSPSSGSGFKIAAIGRLVEKKGFEYLIQAATRLADVHITIFGYGPEEQRLRDLIQLMGVTNVVLAGELPNSKTLHNAYYACDLIVLPGVEAQNGDLDGLPTVLLEAMAAGTPVLTTKIANIPDLILDGVTGFLAKPNDPDSIVEAVHRIRSFPKDRLTQLIADANERARSFASIDQTMTTLLQCWSRRAVDIFLVTYDTDKYANLNDTIEIIDRIYRFTSMPFNLIVVDNNSRHDFKQAIEFRYATKANFSFLQLPENTMCGPASNIALGQCTSEYAIYICSKEGFILKHGWELDIVRAMDKNPKAAIAGHVVTLPHFATGAQILKYPSFPNWRNQQYARFNPNSKISHVQGGFYILRRQAYLDVGGFNEAVAQNGMDVEYSYYLMSKGYELLELKQIASISNKTLPKTFSLVDENTAFVHPSTHNDVSQYDRITQRETQHCVCCGWQGSTFRLFPESDQVLCPSCTSDGFARSTWRYLSDAGRLQVRPNAHVFSKNEGLEKALRTICRTVSRGTPRPTTISSQLRHLRALEDIPELIIVDHLDWDIEVVDAVCELVTNGAMVVLGAPLNGDIDDLKSVADKLGTDSNLIRYISSTGAFDWRTIVVLECPPSSQMTGQGPTVTI